MQALSFRQPWAELVVQGRKTMDLRPFLTRHRGPLAVHASLGVDREACLRFGLDAADLSTGGVIGVVQVVDVIPLTEADYDARRDEHLAGRAFREPLYGWILADPQRLPEAVPARGHMSLFHVDLEPGSTPDMPRPAPLPGKATKTPRKAPAGYDAGLPEGGPDRPFALQVHARAQGSTSYALTLHQRLVEPGPGEPASGSRLPSSMTPITGLDGENLRAVADHVIEALRGAGYRATDLSPERREPFHLPEAVGVRLGLVFLAVKPLTKHQRVEEVSHGIRQMPLEEAYYWYSKCTAANTRERAQKALRTLLAAE